jgi:hypothetical protein
MTEKRAMPLFWFLFGAVFGAALAFLISPLPGPELRARIAEKAEWDRSRSSEFHPGGAQRREEEPAPVMPPGGGMY